MNINKMLVAATLLLASAAANSAPIKYLEITGGDFFIGGTGGSINPAAFANMTVGGYDGMTPPVGYGLDSEASYAPTSIATFTWGFFGPVAVFTSDADGVRSGFAAPTGDITGSTLTLDLSAWTYYWNGTTVNSGSSSDLIAGSICSLSIQDRCSTPILTTYNAMTGEFTASWTAVNIGGATPDEIAEWNITGYVSTVPVPAAVWLFGSGLIGLAGFARHKKALKADQY